MIEVHARGLEERSVYVAHERGNWGPESKENDYQTHKMILVGSHFVLDSSFLDTDEEFKLVVPEISLDEAYGIYAVRQGSVHVNNRMDYDQKQKAFWLLAESHPVVRPEKWNQNNVNRPA